MKRKIRQVNETFLITVLLAVGGSLFFGAFSFIRENVVVSLIFSQIIYVVPAIWYLRRENEPIGERLRLHKIKISTICLLIIFSYFIMPLLTFLNSISLLFSTNTIQGTIDGVITEYPLFVGVFVVAFIPCILEEAIYRGVFFNEYRKINPRKAVLLSGILFGLMHLNWNQFVYAFVMGMIFAIVVEASGSLLSSMVIHFMINGTSVVTAYLQKKLVSPQEGNTIMIDREQLLLFIRQYWMVAIFFTILAYAILKMIAANQNRKQELTELLNGCAGSEKERYHESMVTLPLIIGMLVCLLIMFGVEMM